ncbi:hypothetical protein V8C35DRAFT_301380 [Trichoderma chlorosporum]
MHFLRTKLALGAMAADSFGPFGSPFDLDFDFDFDFPKNPCEWVGATCDPFGRNFCNGTLDAPVALPCGPKGTIGVACCWHEGATNVWYEQWKEWLDKHRRH